VPTEVVSSMIVTSTRGLSVSVVILDGVLGGMLLAAVANLRGKARAKYFIAGLICWPIAFLVCLLSKTNRQEFDGKAPGAPRPRGPKFASITASWVLIVLCFFGFGGITRWLLFRSAPYDLATLVCDRYLLATDVQEAYREDQSANKNAPTITRISDLEEVSRGPADLSCTGSANMSDGKISAISFRYFIEAGTARIAYQLKDR
jgi:hypothetical protein